MNNGSAIVGGPPRDLLLIYWDPSISSARWILLILEVGGQTVGDHRSATGTHRETAYNQTLQNSLSIHTQHLHTVKHSGSK